MNNKKNVEKTAKKELVDKVLVEFKKAVQKQARKEQLLKQLFSERTTKSRTPIENNSLVRLGESRDKKQDTDPFFIKFKLLAEEDVKTTLQQWQSVKKKIRRMEIVSMLHELDKLNIKKINSLPKETEREPSIAKKTFMSAGRKDGDRFARSNLSFLKN